MNFDASRQNTSFSELVYNLYNNEIDVRMVYCGSLPYTVKSWYFPGFTEHLIYHQ